MELQKENDRTSFVEFCESSRKNGHSMGFLYVEGLNSKNLTEEERIRRISIKGKDVMNQLIALNRPDYILYWSCPDKIFELFQSLGFLSNAEELDKLMQIIILSVLFMQLDTTLENVELAGTPTDRMKGDCDSITTGTLTVEGLAYKQGLGKVNKQVPLVSASSTMDDLTRIVACHNWATLKVRVIFKCKTNVVKCLVDCYKPLNPDLTYANIGRSGLLISKSGIPISAHNLSSTTYKKLKTRSFIENTIAQCLKKH